jgi:hypothetical protein
MSELTPCNYCTLQRMKAKRDVILEPADDMPGWTAARYVDEAEPSAYFMELTDSCVC